MARVDANVPPVIRLSKSCVRDAEKEAVLGVLDREYLGMGKEVLDFENALTRFLGRAAVCVVNGTAALHLALQACGVGSGDEVLVPSLTYVASFQAIAAAGAKAVACDIDPETCILDWRDAEKRLTPRTRAIMPVHYSGDVGDIDAIYAFAERHGLRVIEDAAHAFGSIFNGKPVGGFGDVACFSFDGIKNITSGEGGCIVSDDEEVLEKIRDTRLLGVVKDTEKRFQGERSWDFDVVEPGWRYHMSNLMAAIGLAQLNRLDEIARVRRQLARQYDALFADHPRIAPLQRDYNHVVPHIYVVRIKALRDRKLLRNRMLENGVQTGVHYFPNHRLTFFQDSSAEPLPVTDRVYDELLTLPLHPDLSARDVDYVSEQLIRWVDREVK